MNDLAFFNTNVLVYADDKSSLVKQAKTITLFTEHLRKRTAVVSLQVLQEYFAAATRKLGLTAEAAQKKVESIARSRVIRFDSNDVILAIELHRLANISFWDALIVHAARLAGVSVLYSEDFQTGAVIAGVKIVNPFTI